MEISTILQQLLPNVNPLVEALSAIVIYFLVKELNAFNKMKIQLHKCDNEFIGIKKDVETLKNQLEKLEDEHGKLHPRKGGK